MPPQFRRRKLLDPMGEQASYDRAQRRARIIGRVVVAFFAVVVLVAAGGVLTVHNILGKVHIKPLVLPTAQPSSTTTATQNAVAPAGDNSKAQNILVLGVDSREGQNSFAQAKTGPPQTEDLSDTVILVHLSADGKHVTMVSIPRDSVVPIPACDKVDSDGNPVLDSNGNAELTKPVTALYNEAVELGGPSCSVYTLERLTGVSIQHYLEIDFEGLIKMTNAIGGVPITMCSPVHDPYTGLTLPKGPVNLKGMQALEFVRARHGFPGGGDLTRIQRQQQFMASMARKALSQSNLWNFASMLGFYDDVASSLTTDMSHSQLIHLALSYHKINTNDIVFATVPTYDAPKDSGWYQHLFWSKDDAAALFQAIKNDVPLNTTTDANGENVANVRVAPSKISVEVLNGTTKNHLAHDVASELEAKGFKIAGIASATDVPVAKTTISYDASLTDSATTLADALAVAPTKVVSSSTTSTITLTIGNDWKGLAAASPSNSPSNSRSSSSSAPVAGSPSATATIPGLKTTTAKTDNCVEG